MMSALVSEAVRSTGMCGAVNEDGTSVCLLPQEHAPPHGWEAAPHPVADIDPATLNVHGGVLEGTIERILSDPALREGPRMGDEDAPAYHEFLG